MFVTKRQLAVGACGFCAFTNLYPVQALLPELMAEFQASTAELGLSVSAGTIAVALTAPFAGVVSDLLGRRKIIVFCLAAVAVVTLLTAFVSSMTSLIFWRFLAGLFIPGIFATTVAYIGEEWSAKGAVETTAVYIAGTVLGGFSGRLIAGLATEVGGWHAAFIALGLIDLLLVPLVLWWLPESRNFRPGQGLKASFTAMARHLRNPMLLQTFAVSFGMLFSLVAVFTYVSLRLAQAPFYLGTGTIGGIFAVYLLSVVVTPVVGRQIPKWGRAPVAALGVATSLGGLLLTLVPNLPVVVIGLALFSAGLFVLQSIATGFVPQAAAGLPPDREPAAGGVSRSTISGGASAGGASAGGAIAGGASAAVGLYVMAYYIGGSLGAVVPGPFWSTLGWPGCVMLVSLVLVIIGLTGYRLWSRDPFTKRMMAERSGESTLK